MKTHFNSHEKLQTGLSAMQLSLSTDQQSQLIAYLTLLQKWNKTYNLTAITDFEKMIAYHALDSLSVAPYITGNTIVDVGSGAGLPGIPLAIYFPEKQFTLIDSVGKKTRFISQAVRELKLQNVHVIHGRAEACPTQQGFDTMIARAVASIETLVSISKILLKSGGHLLMMKSDVLEVESLSDAYQVIPLTVPGIDAKRSLIILQ